MSRLTSEIKTALLTELCYGNPYGTDNCRRYLPYVNNIFSRSKTLLIGDSLLTDEQLEDLYDIVSSMYSHCVNKPSDYSVAVTVLAIVNICRDYDSQGGGDFYGFIQKKLFGNSPHATDMLSNLKIYEVMKHCFGRVTKHVLFGTKSRTSYYSTILLHAFAPKSSFFALSDALWFIYIERFEDRYSEDDYRDIADAFKAFFSMSKDENAGINVGSQSYAIRSGLRYCALQDQELFIGILKRAFGLFSLYYDNGGEDDARDSSYFVRIFEEWYQNKQQTISNSKTKIPNKREPTVRDYRTAKIRYAFDMDKQVPYLIFPQMRLSGFTGERPVLIVKAGDEELETRVLELGGNEFLRVIRSFRIELSKYSLQNLELSIIVKRGDETIYDSGNEFKRNLLLFNGEKEIVGSRIVKGYYTVFFLGNGDDTFNTCRELSENTYSVQFEIGDDFEIEGKMYHIFDSEELSKSLNTVSIIGRRVKGTKYIDSDGNYPVYSSIKEISFGNYEQHSGIRVEVDGKNYSLSNFSISECVPNDHSIVRVWNADNFEIKDTFALIKDFSYNFDNKYYYTESESAVLHYSIGGIEAGVDFSIGDEFITIKYWDGLIEISVPRISWTITGAVEQPKFTTSVKPLWYEDIRQNAILRINAPSSYVVEGYNLGGSLKRNDADGGFLLGQAIWGNENKQTTGGDIVWITINEEKHKICEVAFYPQIVQKPQITYDSSQQSLNIDFSAGYAGPTDAKFAFEFDNGDVAAFENVGTSATIDLLLEQDTYIFRLYWLKSHSSFVTGMPQRVLVYKGSFLNGTPEELRFSHKTLSIAEYVDFDNAAHAIAINYYAKNLRYSGRVEGFDQYTCEILRDTWNGLVTISKGYLEVIKNNECLLYFYDKDDGALSEFIFRKDNGFIYKQQGNVPSSQFISCNYLKYKEVG
jgi:hypothetical protein